MWYFSLLEQACQLGKLETIQYYLAHYDTSAISPQTWFLAFNKLLNKANVPNTVMLALYDRITLKTDSEALTLLLLLKNKYSLLKEFIRLGKLKPIHECIDQLLDNVAIQQHVWVHLFNKMLKYDDINDTTLLAIYDRIEDRTSITAGNLLRSGRYALLEALVNNGFQMRNIMIGDIFNRHLTKKGLDFISTYAQEHWGWSVRYYLHCCSINLIPHLIERYAISAHELIEQILHCIGQQPSIIHNHDTTRFLVSNYLPIYYMVTAHDISPKKACIECLLWYLPRAKVISNRLHQRILRCCCYQNNLSAAVALLRTMDRDEDWLETCIDKLTPRKQHCPAIIALLRRELDLPDYTRGMASLVRKLPLDPDSACIVVDFLCRPYMREI